MGLLKQQKLSGAQRTTEKTVSLATQNLGTEPPCTPVLRTAAPGGGGFTGVKRRKGPADTPPDADVIRKKLSQEAGIMIARMGDPLRERSLQKGYTLT